MSSIEVDKIVPATGTSLTLGDSGDTFTIPSGVTLTNNGTASGISKIVQISTTSYATPVGANNQDTETFNFEASITPSSVTNQILVLCSVGSISNGGAGRMISKLRWNTSSGGVTGTELTVGQTANDSSDTNGLSTITLISQFTPATTSTIYIKNTVSKSDGGAQWYVQRFSGYSYITLMEILN